jgi:chemotaxis protein methyltransferase CheR
MKDTECVAFLQWALPQLGLRWPGFRKVRRQVCKRIARRIKKLGFETVDQYRARLTAEPDEWRVLDAACRITISRFYRDKHVFDVLRDRVLPALFETANKEQRPVRCWCAGCASGEEVYSLAILPQIAIHPAVQNVGFSVLGTDADPVMIARAERGCYAAGSLKDIPENWLSLAFISSDGDYCVKPEYRKNTKFLRQDIRDALPGGPFDLVLCRNLVFTYFMPDAQSAVLGRIVTLLRPSGYLVIGAHEHLPAGDCGLEPLATCREILRRPKATDTAGSGP